MTLMLAAKTFFETPAAQLSPQVEQVFFSSLMTRNKTYKTTFPQRFSDTNRLILEQLKRQELREASVLDMAISSGVSTVELYEDLRAGGQNITIIATDVLIDAFLIRVLPSCFALVDETGFPLRFDLPFCTMKPWIIRRDYYSGFFIFRKVINVVLGRTARRILRDRSDKRITKVRLVTPRLLENDRITICTDDICKYNHAFNGKFDAIRAANILNIGYFTPATTSSIISNIGRYLRRPQGALFVVRTHEDRTNHGTLFRLGNNDRFEVINRVGDGSEIEDIVLRTEISPR